LKTKFLVVGVMRAVAPRVTEDIRIRIATDIHGDE
jgi:hypothetical protein